MELRAFDEVCSILSLLLSGTRREEAHYAENASEDADQCDGQRYTEAVGGRGVSFRSSRVGVGVVGFCMSILEVDEWDCEQHDEGRSCFVVEVGWCFEILVVW